MTWIRAISPPYLSLPVIEGYFSPEKIEEMNATGYNIYYFPNHPEAYPDGANVSGPDIDTFKWVFVDLDMKDGKYESKDAFIEKLADLLPTKIIDSGNGIHAYWRISDLDAKSYLRLSRRLMRYFDTDDACQKICQLMRLEGTLNTKVKESLKLCEVLADFDKTYTCEELNSFLPVITLADEQYCESHYNKTFAIESRNLNIPDKMPVKFGKLLEASDEAKKLWSANTNDRSGGDYRLGHLMFAQGFTKEEARTVLANSAKALARAPIHRINYADNIIEKIWTYEIEPKASSQLSSSVEDILNRSGDTLKGTPFRCHKRIDNTEHGFRLGQVIGLVAGSGVGKTAFALNMFKWFTEQNPDYYHFFIPLEQPANEIADRWNTMCGPDKSLNKKVHVMSNYDDQGNFRHLSFEEIKDYIKQWQEETGHKVGCIVIDHIGALKKKGKDGENQDLMDICHSMKAFAVQTNTLLVMQSQSSREKAGIGDLELNKDAAYGTVYFESYCDYLITLWQPVKRFHKDAACPTVTAFKFCKIRHKKPRKDVIQEDTPYFFSFDSENELMRDMTQDEITSFDYFLPQATKKRSADRKTEIVDYKSVPWEGHVTASVDSIKHSTRH